MRSELRNSLRQISRRNIFLRLATSPSSMLMKINLIITQEGCAKSFSLRINHRYPIRVKPSVSLCICNQTVAAFIFLKRPREKFIGTFSKIIIINKIIASVVGWINIDHLDLTEISLLQQLERV